MDHPLRDDKNKKLRARVVQILRDGFHIQRQSNIVFVCGGNKASDMRRRFQTEFSKLLSDFEFFEPEFAMVNYFAMGDTEPFDIADFEELVGELSIAIVLFPEGPGSFAELGYFAGQPTLLRRVVLAVDSNHQRSDSFISLGPASKVDQHSVFKSTIQLNYEDPDFELISQRIKDRVTLKTYRKKFQPTTFASLSAFELFALVHQIVALLVVATVEDIEYFLRSLFDSHISESKTKKIVSILLGSGRLAEVGDFGHLAAKEGKQQALLLQEGFVTEHYELTAAVSAELYSSGGEFLAVLGALEKC